LIATLFAEAPLRLRQINPECGGGGKGASEDVSTTQPWTDPKQTCLSAPGKEQPAHKVPSKVDLA